MRCLVARWNSWMIVAVTKTQRINVINGAQPWMPRTKTKKTADAAPIRAGA